MFDQLLFLFVINFRKIGVDIEDQNEMSQLVK